jgi:hypothetical protein
MLFKRRGSKQIQEAPLKATSLRAIFHPLQRQALLHVFRTQTARLRLIILVVSIFLARCFCFKSELSFFSSCHMRHVLRANENFSGEHQRCIASIAIWFPLVRAGVSIRRSCF